MIQEKKIGNDLKIGIVTVCLNSANTIEQTILSVLNQGYKNVEHIIIDGASTDGTVEILKKYSGRIAYWVSEKDSGIGQANNKGIQKSTADVILLLPSDDFIQEDFCEKMMECFNRNGPDTDFIYGDVIMCDSQGHMLYKVVGQMINYFGVKKSAHDELGVYDENLDLNHDVDFLQRMKLAGKKGVYCNIARWMRMGGVSERGKLRGLRLLIKIERRNGKSFVCALSRYSVRSVLYFAEYFIRHCFGLKSLFKFYDVKFLVKKSLRVNW